MRGAGWMFALGLAAVGSSLLFTPGGAAQQRQIATLTATLTDTARATTRSRSVGLPWAGTLLRGELLKESSRLRYLPAHARRRNFYGTSELVALLEHGAESVARRWPGSRLTVGELSARGGGHLAHHHSHRSGRDVDVAFYMRDAGRGFAQFDRFLAFGRRGPLPGAAQDLRFDDERNWELVSRWLGDPDVRVQYIFVSKPLRNRLLVAGRRRGASDELLRRSAAVMVQPRHGEPHTDHFHLRIYCSKDDRPRCKDAAPFWPWYDGEPGDGGFAELPTIRWGVEGG